MDLLNLKAILTLDSSEYESGLAGAEQKGSSFGNGLKAAAKGAGVALAAVGTAVVGAGTAFVKGAGNVAQYGDTIDKESQKLGMSAEAYQEWDAILQHTGGSIENLKPAFKTLSKEIVNNSEAFQQLGISQQEMLGMSKEEVFARVITELQGMEDGVERTRLATELLGKGSIELGALLNTSSEETEEMRQRVHELGGVMSDEAVKASASYRDSLQDLKTGFSGLKNNLMADFLPGITGVMDGFTELLLGNKDEGLQIVSEGINGIITTISEKLPEFVEVAGGIITSFLTAITENLPTIFAAGTDLVMQIVDGVLENLPDIVKAGLDVIVSLAQGIADSLPELVPTIVDVVLQIVDTLTDPDTLSALIDAAIAIIIALANGIIESLPELLERAPEIISNLVTALIENVPKLISAAIQIMISLAKGILDNLPEIFNAAGQIVMEIVRGIIGSISSLFDVGKDAIQSIKDGFSNLNPLEWGKDLISNFVEGIKQKWEDLKSSVRGVAQTVKDFLGFSEPEEGPLSNFHTYAPDMMQLFAKGVKDNKDMLTKVVSDAFDFGDIVSDAQVSPESSSGAKNDFGAEISEYIKNALSGIGVYMDGRIVGQLVTNYQRSNTRAAGL